MVGQLRFKLRAVPGKNRTHWADRLGYNQGAALALHTGAIWASDELDEPIPIAELSKRGNKDG